MKRRTLVALVVTAVVIGGLLLLFPAEWVGLLIALVVLLTAQAVLLMRHTRVLPHAPGSGVRPVFSASHSSAQDIPQDVAPRAYAAPREAPAESMPPLAGAGAPVTPDVFSRFRAHLETMEQGAPRPAGSAPSAPSAQPGAAAPGAATEEVADRVQLSSGARRAGGGAATRAQGGAAPKAQGGAAPRAQGGVAPSAEATATAPMSTPAPQTQSAPSPPAQPAAAAPATGATGAVNPPAAAKAPPKAAPLKPLPKVKPQKPAVDDEEGPDLFADLRPALAVGRAGAGVPSPADKPAMAAALPKQDEVGQALAQSREPRQLREEAAALLRIAQEALDDDDLPRVKAVLGQHASLIGDAPDLASAAAARVELRLAAREGRAEAVAPAYQAMLDRGYAPAEADLEPELDALLEGLSAESRASAKAAALAKALAPFRQAGDRAAMDRIYDRIEATQEAAGDPRKLIQFYKNHLSIEEALGDTAGRLNLIDKIGNRYFQLGESAPAREFYEMGMKLRLEQDARQTAPGQAESSPETALTVPGAKREG